MSIGQTPPSRVRSGTRLVRRRWLISSRARPSTCRTRRSRPGRCGTRARTTDLSFLRPTRCRTRTTSSMMMKSASILSALGATSRRSSSTLVWVFHDSPSTEKGLAHCQYHRLPAWTRALSILCSTRRITTIPSTTPNGGRRYTLILALSAMYVTPIVD